VGIINTCSRNHIKKARREIGYLELSESGWDIVRSLGLSYDTIAYYPLKFVIIPGKYLLGKREAKR
jgi:hypothetical protein